MAICLRNRDFLTSFFLCFLPILIVYYPLMIFGADQAKNGNLPTIFVWAGNVMLMLWGVWLLRRVIRYLSLPARDRPDHRKPRARGQPPRAAGRRPARGTNPACRQRTAGTLAAAR